MPKVDGKERPTAWGHRFGPDLACSECGLTWDEHQRDPAPCTTAGRSSNAPPFAKAEPPKSAATPAKSGDGGEGSGQS